MSGKVSFSIDLDDKAAMSEAAQMLLTLAGGSAAVVVAGALPGGAVTECPVLTPSVPEAPVNTAAVFGGTDMPPAVGPHDGELRPATTATALPPAAPQAPTPPAAPQAPTPPAAPQAPAAAPPAGVPLDKSGLPWDARINTSNKVTTAKGIWKMLKSLPEGFYDQVVAELKQTMAAPAAAPAPVAPTPPVAATPPAPPATPAPPAAPAAPVRTMLNGADYDAYIAAGWTDQQMIDAGHMTLTPAAPAAPLAPSAPDEAEPATYAQLLGVVAPRIAAKKITHEEVSGVCAAAGLPDLNSVSARPDLVGTIYQGCKAIWATRG